MFVPFLDEMVPGGQGWDRGPEQVSCASCILEAWRGKEREEGMRNCLRAPTLLLSVQNSGC